NDLAVAAHGPVEPLQVAVDDKDEVVELFASGNADSAGRFGLVHFAITQKRPYLAGRRRQQSAILQIAHETSLVDGIDQSKTHGDGGELPEILHQPGMGIGGKTRLAAQFVAEVFQVLLREPAFKEGTGIDTRGGMALEVDQVARLIAVAPVEEMIEADFKK